MRMPALLGVFLAAALFDASGCASLPREVRSDPALRSAALNLRNVQREERRESLTWDVTKRPLGDRPWLGSNDEVRARLGELRAAEVADESRIADAREVLGQMIALGAAAHETSMRGMAVSSARRARVLESLRSLQEAERSSLPAAGDAPGLRRWARARHRALPPANPNGGAGWRRALAFPAVPFLYAWIWHHVETEDKGPYPHDFEALRLFVPDSSADARILANLPSATDGELLRAYAPLIVQQVDPQATYPAEVDRIGAGAVRLTGDARVESWVDTARPTVYARTSRARIGGAWHTQLNYSLWYPEHPPMKPGDPEAGHTEGVLIRITLDGDRHPILAETCFACGCFHRVFPVEALERAATEQFGRIESGRSPLARRRPRRVDAILPQSMGNFSPEFPHPVVYIYSGKHFAGAVEFGGYHAEPAETASYVLEPEETLEALPLAGGISASFFGRDGLVRGADRPEATMLWPTGFYHAGTPRIHDAHLIHFDQYDYNDPHLLEQLLRVPSLGGVLKDSVHSPYSRTPGGPPAPRPAPDDATPRAKKKAFFCPC